MDKLYSITQESILAKEIQNSLPSSNFVDSRTFSRLLNDDKVVASYKMYWFLAILKEVSIGNRDIKFRTLIARMIVSAWYPIMQYKLSFGAFDNLKKLVSYIADNYEVSANCDEEKLFNTINTVQDKELEKMIRELTYLVPYRLLSPFFEEELKGMPKGEKKRLIVELSQGNENSLYKIVEDRIIVSENWSRYLNDNYRIIKAWIYFKIVVFLQKRNLNVPAIALKLEPPRSRNLTKSTKLWNKIILSKNITDIYTGEKFTVTNYERLGSLSVDHFIPWSFVMHDQLWNLTPTFKNINSKKSDKLLPYNKYMEKFCNIQYEAFDYVCENKINSFVEEYIDALRVEEIYDFHKHASREKFSEEMRKCIMPLYQIAENQGFVVMDKFDFNQE
ncbi:hypothetical protein CFOLD11_11890 [Clostridium folliculivorans]|uniref:HNH nuclease domain-containing protein n=1 Tax=Clostridium folliculivorans TaxID=2886038 RepID=A0A9W6DA68_9CLOT|nr:HNH endonuclease domain-containing protein [Clostridium folliculivorans]GKU24363.1 hypothetical protein CFOLD11_11890 [Clostridium folliculivorans]